ncbi:MAG: hypothetical protein U0R52_04475 [Solirubrobacterales bacterium]
MFVGSGRAQKPREREEARRLRREKGLPYRRIAEMVGVSTNSVFNWTRDIPITEQQRRRNAAHMTAGTEAHRRRARRWSETSRAKRLEYQAEGRRRARAGDPHHQAGCMLYWAEGAKDRNRLKLTNSDVHMLVYFRCFLTECMEVDPDKIRFQANVYLGNGLTIAEIHCRWLQALDLPKSCLLKPTVNYFPTSSSGKKKNRLPFGVGSISVCDTRLVQHIFGAIQEYGGFEEPRWLDCDPPRSEGTPAGPSGHAGGSRPGPRPPSDRRRGGPG